MLLPLIMPLTKWVKFRRTLAMSSTSRMAAKIFQPVPRLARRGGGVAAMTGGRVKSGGGGGAGLCGGGGLFSGVGSGGKLLSMRVKYLKEMTAASGYLAQFAIASIKSCNCFSECSLEITNRK